MAFLFVRTPPIQTLCWRPATDDLPASYHFHNFDNALAYDRLDEYAMKKIYLQPVQTTDKVRFYFDTNGISITVECYSANGTQIGTLESTQTWSTYGVFTGNTEQGVQLNTFYQQLTIPSGEKIVQYKAIVTFSGGQTRSYLSELCHLKASHDNTHLIEYTHDRNEHYVRFANYSFHFALRVYGDQPKLITGSESVLTKGYNEQIKPVKTINYRSWVFNFGDQYGVPDWVIDRFNWIIGCSTIKISGDYYSREEETKLDTKEVPGYPFFHLSFQLRDAKHDGFAYSANVIDLITIPSYPAAIPAFAMVTGIFQYIVDNTPQVFDNAATDLEAYKDWLNATFAVNNNLTGVFSRSGNVISYTNGEGETFLQVPITVYVKFLSFSITLAAVLAWRYRFYFGGIHVTDWGDGNIEAFTSNNTTIINVNHTYTTNGNKTVRLFHNDGIQYLASQEAALANILRNISGNAPTALKVFDFRYGDYSALGTSFDPTFLYPARFSLQTLIISNSKIDGFNTPLFGVGGSGAWSALTYLDLRVNSLSSAEVDEIFTARYAISLLGALIAFGGTYLVNLQNPTQAPTSASLTARNAIDVTCTIVTD